MYEYSREVYYYETDAMGVAHHSNIVRWLEEARLAFFAAIGLPYEDTEACGVLSPVMALDIRFRHFARFGDRFTVRMRMTKYTGVRFYIGFAVFNMRGDLLAEGSSDHAFVDRSYRPVSLKKAIPHKHGVMLEHVESPEHAGGRL